MSKQNQNDDCQCKAELCGCEAGGGCTCGGICTCASNCNCQRACACAKADN